MIDNRKPPFMRRKAIVISLAFVLIFCVLSVVSWIRNAPPNPVPDRGLETLFSPAELASDLKFMRATFEEIHPDLYYYQSKESADSLFAELVKNIKHPMTRREFWPIAARYAASFGDGHTALWFPSEEIRKRIKEDSLWFPIEVDEFDGRRLRILHNYDSTSSIPEGAWITNINDHPIVDLFPEFISMMSGEKKFYRSYYALRNLKYLLWLYGIEAPFEVEWMMGEGGKPRTTIVRGVSMEMFNTSRRKMKAATADFSFKRIADDIGYLNFRRMRGLAAFQVFLKRTFQAIRKHPIHGLIIDLRQNGGGSTALGDSLLSYISNKPYRMISRMDLKISRRKKQFLKAKYLPRALRWLPIQYLNPDWRRIWQAPEGSIVSWKIKEKQPPENPLRYHGPVCVLIGVRTFSSAQKLINAIKDYKLATLIGTETGGNPNAFGELLTFRLPHTRLLASASTKRYIRANGDASWRRGILPDIKVTATGEDIREGKDPVLEAALDWINRQRSSVPEDDIGREE